MDIPSVKIPYIKNEKNSWIIHSHPDGTPLSKDDILNSRKKGGTIFAIDADNSIYRSTKLSTNDEIIKAYNEARDKIKNLGIGKQILEEKLTLNPSINPLTVKQDIAAIATHKIWQHLNKLGLIKYRTQLSNATKRKLHQYQAIMDIQLKRYLNNLVEFKYR